MTRHQQLRTEVAATEIMLTEAVSRLLNWADVLAASFFTSAIPPEEIRQVAEALSRQCGRLSMAREMAGKGGAA